MRERYELREGVVFDHKTGTGLEWEAKVHGPMTWRAALEYAKSLGEGWRLPSIAELSTLVDHKRHNPASTFPGMTGQWFWSASTYEASLRLVWLVWLVDFNDGQVIAVYETSTNYVRCVRGPLVAPEGEKQDA